MDLAQFLENEGLSHLLDFMLVEGVTVEILLQANDGELSELCRSANTKFADKIRLRSALEKIKQQKSFTASISTFLPERQSILITGPSGTLEGTPLESVPEQVQLDTSVQATPEPVEPGSPVQAKSTYISQLEPSKSKDFSFSLGIGEEFDFFKDIDTSSIDSKSQSQLRKLLFKHTRGKLLLEKSEKGAPLTSRDRFYIVSLIVEAELQLLEKLNQNIRKDVWLKWSDEITTLFKGELRDLYYVPYHIVGGKVIQASGLIHNRLITHRRTLSEESTAKKRRGNSDSSDSGCSSKSSEPIEATNNRVRPLPDIFKQTTDHLNCEETLDWLRGTSYPQEALKVKWQATFELRMKLLKEISFVEYFNSFPGLTLPNGHELLTSDFETVYPTANNTFEEKFPLVKLKLLKLLADKAGSNKSDDTIVELLDLASAGEEQANVAALLGIVTLLRQMHTVTVPKKKLWRLTRDETRTGFVARVASSSEIGTFSTQRDQFNTVKGIPSQPYILAVGPSWTNVYMYEIVTTAGPHYQVPTISEAIKLTFNLYWALDCAYPKAAFPCWMFIQRAIFDMKSKYDVEGSPLRELLSQLNSV